MNYFKVVPLLFSGLALTACSVSPPDAPTPPTPTSSTGTSPVSAPEKELPAADYLLRPGIFKGKTFTEAAPAAFPLQDCAVLPTAHSSASTGLQETTNTTTGSFVSSYVYIFSDNTAAETYFADIEDMLPCVFQEESGAVDTIRLTESSALGLEMQWTSSEASSPVYVLAAQTENRVHLVSYLSEEKEDSAGALLLLAAAKESLKDK